MKNMKWPVIVKAEQTILDLIVDDGGDDDDDDDGDDGGGGGSGNDDTGTPLTFVL